MKKILLFCGSLIFSLGISAQVVNSFPYNEDFEPEPTCGTSCNNVCNLIGDYSNDPSGQQDWSIDINGTGSFNTGPTINGGADKNPGISGGKYLYVETSSCAFQTALLNSPYLDLTTTSAINVSFWYHMFGATMGTLHFDVDTTKGQGAWIQDVIPSFTDDVDLWQEQVVSLSPYAGRDSVRFRFRFITGSSFTSDVALDDITIFVPAPIDFEAISLDNVETNCGLGAAEQVGFSALHNGSDTLFTGDTVTANYSVTSNGITSNVQEVFTLSQNYLSGDTVSYLFTQTVDLSAFEDYDFTLYLNHPADTFDNTNDTLTETVISVPSISTLPYSEDFENGNGGWRAEGTGITWELGYPAKPTIIGANSDSNAWVVGGLTSQVTTTEQSWLVGPCFDFSMADTTTYFVANIWWDAYEFGHAMRLEYSIDSGATWVVMGDDSDPNWYNRSFPSGFPTSSDGWTGRSSSNLSSNGYVSVFRPLDSALIGQPSAMIRFYFGVSSTVNADGFAIDDISIGTPDLVDLGGDMNVCDGHVIDPALPANGTFRWFKDGTLSGLGSTFTVGGIDTASSSVNIVLTYTDPIGVVSSDTIDVAVNSFPTATAANVIDATCNGAADGSASVNVSGGSGSFSYNWSNGDTLATSSNLIAGSYTVMVTDDSTGCTSSVAVIVNEPTAVVVTANATNVGCNGGSDGSATASASGGTGPYTYLWSNAGTTATITALSAGTYTTTVTDANGCTATNSATITEPAPIGVMFSKTDVSCNGSADGLAVVTASGGSMPYSYAWSNGGTSFVQTGLAQGTYIVTVTDQNNCSSIDSVMIAEPTAIVASIASTNPTCNGNSDGSAALTTTGGTAPYSYIWSNGATTDSIGSLVAGTYLATITDANNCSVTTFTTLTEPAVLAVSITATDLTCNGSGDGSATLATTGGTAPYAYLWSNGASTATINSLVAGTYTVTVTDTNNCTTISSATLTEPAALDTTLSQTGFTLMTNQNGATYQWIDCAADTVITGATSQSYTALRNGDYQVEMTLNGCVDTSTCITVLGVGINAIEVNQVDLSIYPNPTKDAFTIEVDKFNTFPLQLFDVNGALVEIITLQSKKEVIDISHLPSGVYHVRFGTTSKKLVITQ